MDTMLNKNAARDRIAAAEALKQNAPMSYAHMRMLHDNLYTSVGRRYFLTQLNPEEQMQIVRVADDANRAWGDNFRAVLNDPTKGESFTPPVGPPPSDRVPLQPHELNPPGWSPYVSTYADPAEAYSQPSSKLEKLPAHLMDEGPTGGGSDVAQLFTPRRLVDADGVTHDIDTRTDEFRKHEGWNNEDYVDKYGYYGTTSFVRPQYTPSEKIATPARQFLSERVAPLARLNPELFDGMPGVVETLADHAAIESLDAWKAARLAEAAHVRLSDKMRTGGLQGHEASVLQNGHDLMRGLYAEHEIRTPRSTHESEAERARRLSVGPMGPPKTGAMDAVSETDLEGLPEFGVMRGPRPSVSSRLNALELLRMYDPDGHGIARHAMTETLPDGTLRYPDEALRTALMLTSRIAENRTFPGVQAHVNTAMDFINAVRAGDGLPPASLGANTESLITEAGHRMSAEIENPTGRTGEGRRTVGFPINNATRWLRDELEVQSRLNPIALKSVSVDDPLRYEFSRPDPTNAPAAPPSDPAGVESPGTSQDFGFIGPPVQTKLPRPPSPAPYQPPGVNGTRLTTDQHLAEVRDGNAIGTQATQDVIDSRQSRIDWLRQKGHTEEAAAAQTELDALKPKPQQGELPELKTEGTPVTTTSPDQHPNGATQDAGEDDMAKGDIGKQVAKAAETLAGAGEAAPAAKRVAIAPPARAHAKANNVDLSQVTGTGKNGAITKADVQAYIDSNPAAPAAEKGPLPPVGTGQTPAASAAKPAPAQQNAAPAAPSGTVRAKNAAEIVNFVKKGTNGFDGGIPNAIKKYGKEAVDAAGVSDKRGSFDLHPDGDARLAAHYGATPEAKPDQLPPVGAPPASQATAGVQGAAAPAETQVADLPGQASRHTIYYRLPQDGKDWRVAHASSKEEALAAASAHPEAVIGGYAVDGKQVSLRPQGPPAGPDVKPGAASPAPPPVPAVPGSTGNPPGNVISPQMIEGVMKRIEAAGYIITPKQAARIIMEHNSSGKWVLPADATPVGGAGPAPGAAPSAPSPTTADPSAPKGPTTIHGGRHPAAWPSGTESWATSGAAAPAPQATARPKVSWRDKYEATNAEMAPIIDQHGLEKIANETEWRQDPKTGAWSRPRPEPVRGTGGPLPENLELEDTLANDNLDRAINGAPLLDAEGNRVSGSVLPEVPEMTLGDRVKQAAGGLRAAVAPAGRMAATSYNAVADQVKGSALGTVGSAVGRAIPSNHINKVIGGAAVAGAGTAALRYIPPFLGWVDDEEDQGEKKPYEYQGWKKEGAAPAGTPPAGPATNDSSSLMSRIRRAQQYA